MATPTKHTILKVAGTWDDRPAALFLDLTGGMCPIGYYTSDGGRRYLLEGDDLAAFVPTTADTPTVD